MKFKFIVGLIPLVFCACMSTNLSNNASDITLESFATLVGRTFETPTSDTKNIIRDRRVRIRSDALLGVWLYSQMNTGETHKLYRQRVLQFTLSEDGKKIIQKAYSLNNPDAYVDVWGKPNVLKILTPDDIKPYFSEGCDQVWRQDISEGWKGYVDPKTCTITSKRRNTDIRIESEGYLSKSEYRTTERGYDTDMNFLWGSKPGEMITLYPVN